jgi:hypothetical protein
MGFTVTAFRDDNSIVTGQHFDTVDEFTAQVTLYGDLYLTPGSEISIDITVDENVPAEPEYDAFEADPAPNSLEETNGLLRRLISAVEGLTGRR